MGVVGLVQYCIDHELGRRGRSLYAAEFYRGGAAGVYLVLIAFRRFRNRVMLRLLFLTIALKERGDTGTFNGNRFMFGEEGFWAITVGDMMWKYPAVDKVAESRDAVFLYFKEDSGLYFAKRDFTVGDSKAFLQFIAEKTGKEVIRLKGSRR